jgi:hypothetical protein
MAATFIDAIFSICESPAPNLVRGFRSMMR